MRLLSSLLLLSFAACGSDSPSSTAQHNEAPTKAATLQRPAKGLEQQTYFDLVKHRAWAELRDPTDALVVNFGNPGAAKYTFGGWRTRVRRNIVRGGASASTIKHVTGKFYLPAKGSEDTLSLRVASKVRGSLTVYLNDKTLGHAKVSTEADAWSKVELAVPAGLLVAGENTVQLRVANAPRSEIYIDWVRLGQGKAGFDTLPPLTAQNTLTVPQGWSLSYALETDEASKIQGEVRGKLSLVHSGSEEETLHDSFSVSLKNTGLQTLTLTAKSGIAVLNDAKILVAAAKPKAALPSPIANVLIYLVDTARADKFTPWNSGTRVKTPGLSSFAKQGTVFGRAHTQENWTKPSVATLLTGLLPWEHTATADDAVLPRRIELLSETLQDAGFYTGAFIANGYVSGKFGFRQGWSTFRNYIREGRRTQARFVASDVLNWLDARPKDKRFFLYVHTIDPHVPYIPPPDLLKLYDPSPYDGPIDFRKDRELLEKIKGGKIKPNRRDKRRLEALYDGELSYHDVHFASIIEALKKRKLNNDTVVVFTSDHGEEMFDHDSVGHGHSQYEELLHIPYIIFIPGIQSDGIEHPVGLVDVAPTVLEALGQKSASSTTGSSLIDMMRGAIPDAPRVTLSGFKDGWRTVQTRQYKLIQRTENTPMLFDLAKDPDEKSMISQRPALLRYMRGLMGLALSSALTPRTQSETTIIDPKTEAQLRALGYVGSSRPSSAGTSKP